MSFEAPRCEAVSVTKAGDRNKPSQAKDAAAETERERERERYEGGRREEGSQGV